MNIRAKFHTISLKTSAFIKDLEGSSFFWSLGILYTDSSMSTLYKIIINYFDYYTTSNTSQIGIT